MAKYCTCKVCKPSGAKPNQDARGLPEVVEGKRIVLNATQVLCHWSDREFVLQSSTEIAKLTKSLGSEVVCGSFFLYDDLASVPDRIPKALTHFGIAGRNKYIVTNALDRAPIYLKFDRDLMNGAEVVVCFGHGGGIRYDTNKTATAYIPGKFA